MKEIEEIQPHDPAFPAKHNDYNNGLTKLEYAAIHMPEIDVSWMTPTEMAIFSGIDFPLRETEKSEEDFVDSMFYFRSCIRAKAKVLEARNLIEALELDIYTENITNRKIEQKRKESDEKKLNNANQI